MWPPCPLLTTSMRCSLYQLIKRWKVQVRPYGSYKLSRRKWFSFPNRERKVTEGQQFLVSLDSADKFQCYFAESIVKHRATGCRPAYIGVQLSIFIQLPSLAASRFTTRTLRNKVDYKLRLEIRETHTTLSLNVASTQSRIYRIGQHQ